MKPMSYWALLQHKLHYQLLFGKMNLCFSPSWRNKDQILESHGGNQAYARPQLPCEHRRIFGHCFCVRRLHHSPGQWHYFGDGLK